MKKLSAWMPDFTRKEFFWGEIHIDGEFITEIKRISNPDGSFQRGDKYILPGLVDSHVHIESSMMVPSGYAKEAVRFGTLACIADPHEIANVLGEEGIRFMIRDAEKVPMKIRYSAPSCVPATDIEESGARLGAKELRDLAAEYDFAGLGEMMNFPGVISGDEEVKEKINMFLELGKPADGHAPGLKGDDLRKYVGAGISTDHEVVYIDEGREKIKHGMKVLIREGSAAKNFENLWPLIQEFPEMVMLCCDDIHPDDMLKGYINDLIRRGLAKGLNIFDLLRCASVNPVEHYSLNMGLLRKGDRADFIVVEDIDSFIIEESYIEGKCVFSNQKVNFKCSDPGVINNFNRTKVRKADFEMLGDAGKYRAISVIDGDLYTKSEIVELKSEKGTVCPDNEQDILLLALVNRYNNSAPALAWIKNTGLKRGALASSIAHDNHNIIALGTNSRDIADAVNLIIDNQGGMASSESGDSHIMKLPIAGLMSAEPAEKLAYQYNKMNQKAFELGTHLKAPFMTLSFMALIVIPEFKIGNKGLFDVKEFNFVDVKID